jgi:hypothetical protein
MTIKLMPSVGIVPEISHGEVDLEEVSVPRDDLLPGDGYERYIRPFRTVEDIHVVAGVIGYLSGVAREYHWDHAVQAELLGIIAALRPLSMANPSAPAIHVALEGVYSVERRVLSLIQPMWDSVAEDVRHRWERDVAILNVAEKVRAARFATAWDKLETIN